MSLKSNRRIVIVRHGERVDHRFQDEWVNNCFDNEGNYTRQNLNQPATLPMRKGYPKTFIRDSPLTAIGCLQATLRGQGIAAGKVLSDDFEVFVSPSLRCVKTASNVLKGLNNSNRNIKMCVEPCLFEWTSIKWYLNGNMPNWMTIEELSNAGFNVDSSYKPFVKMGDMKEEETCEAYYERSYNLIVNLLNQTGDKDLLLVAHGFSFDALSRQLLGKRLSTVTTLVALTAEVPYCGMMILEQDPVTKTWNILPLPKQLQLLHKSAHEFDACKVFV